MPPVAQTVAANATQGQSDLLVMHEIGLAPAMGAGLEVLRCDAQQRRAYRRCVCTPC